MVNPQCKSKKELDPQCKLPRNLFVYLLGFLPWTMQAFLISHKWHDAWLQCMVSPQSPTRVSDIVFQMQTAYQKETHLVDDDQEEDDIVMTTVQEGSMHTLHMRALVATSCSNGGTDILHTRTINQSTSGRWYVQRPSLLRVPSIESLLLTPMLTPTLALSSKKMVYHTNWLSRVKACVLQCDSTFTVSGLSRLASVEVLTLQWRSKTPCGEHHFRWGRGEQHETMPSVRFLRLVGFSNIPPRSRWRDFSVAFPNLKTLVLLHCTTDSAGYISTANVDLEDILQEPLFAATKKRASELPFRVFWNAI